MNTNLRKLEKSIAQTLGDATKLIQIEGKLLEYKGILVYQQHNMLLLLKYDQNVRVDFSTILSYNVRDNSSLESYSSGSIATSTTTTDTGSLLGRAAVGGIVAGGVGAIIGASSAKKNTETSFGGSFSTTTTKHDYTLYLNVNSLENPVIEIYFSQDEKALNETIATLNVILNLSLEKTTAKQYDEKIEALDTYHIVEQEMEHQKRMVENEKRENQRKLVNVEVEKLQAENTAFKANPWTGLKHFFSWGHLVTLLSIPLGLASTLTFSGNVGWWMIATYFLFIFAIMIPWGVGMAIMPSSRKNVKDKRPYDEGFLSGVAIILAAISTFPFFLMSRDFTISVYSILGIFYDTYEGGIIVSCAVFGVIYCSYALLSECYHESVRRPGEAYKRAFHKRFVWGTTSGVFFSIVLFFISLLFGWAIFSNKSTDTIDPILIETSSESSTYPSTSTYHNVRTGERQYEYKNSREQANDLKEIDELIREEEKMGKYDNY